MRTKSFRIGVGNFYKKLLLGLCLLALLNSSCDALVGSFVGPVKTGLDDSINRLNTAISNQRASLTADTAAILAETTANLGVLSAQIDMGLRGLEEKAAADVMHNVSVLLGATDRLTIGVQGGVAQTISQLSQEVNRQLQTTNGMLVSAIDQVRPLLASATRSGDQLIAHVVGETTVLLFRGGFAVFALVALIGLVIVLIKKTGAAPAVVLGILFVLGIGGAVAGRPIARLFAGTEVRFPDPETNCQNMAQQGQRLMALLGGVARVEQGARSSMSPLPPRPAATDPAKLLWDPEFSRSILGGAKRRILDRAANFTRTGVFLPPAGAESAAAAEARKLAEALRSSALICSTYTPTPQLVAEARRYLVLANQYLGAPVICTSSNQCLSGQRCDTVTGECLALGVFCEEPMHCDAGRECDRSQRRCVPVQSYKCAPGKDCRIGEVCTPQGLCQSVAQAAGRPCEVPDAQGPCREGRTAVVGSALVCQSVRAREPERCDNIDNDCNGFIDDGNPGGGAACVNNQIAGECRFGVLQCTGGALKCKAGSPRTEQCDNKDNDCDGMIDDDNACPSLIELSKDDGCSGTGILFNLDGCRGDASYGGPCHSGQVRKQCLVTRQSAAGSCYMTGWKSADPTDCTCNVHFGAERSVQCHIEITSVKRAVQSP